MAQNNKIMRMMFCQARFYNKLQKYIPACNRGFVRAYSSDPARDYRHYGFNQTENSESENEICSRMYFHYKNQVLKGSSSYTHLFYSQPKLLTNGITMLDKISKRGYTTSLNTVQENLAFWAAELEDAGVPESQLSVEHIIAHVLSVPKRTLEEYVHSNLSEDLLHEIERLMTCRLARMPVQYIVGEWDFHNITLKMRPPVFIPRPETECLVEKALEHLRGILNPRVLEIGCGSGAISLALLKSVKDLECVAVDQSKHAVELTKENAENLSVNERLTVIEGKVTKGHFPVMPFKKFDLVVSNPPYVLRKDLMGLQPEIMLFEDLRALDGGKDGLDTIKLILQHCQDLVSPGSSILIEVDPCHRYLIPGWLKTKTDIEVEITKIFQDFAGKDRFIEFTKL